MLAILELEAKGPFVLWTAPRTHGTAREHPSRSRRVIYIYIYNPIYIYIKNPSLEEAKGSFIASTLRFELPDRARPGPSRARPGPTVTITGEIASTLRFELPDRARPGEIASTLRFELPDRARPGEIASTLVAG